MKKVLKPRGLVVNHNSQLSCDLIHKISLKIFKFNIINFVLFSSIRGVGISNHTC